MSDVPLESFSDSESFLDPESFSDPLERFLGDDDQGYIEEALQFVQYRWKEIGSELNLTDGVLNNFLDLDPAEATGRMVESYLACKYDIQKYHYPTWNKIIKALDNVVGEKAAARAKIISEKVPDIEPAEMKIGYDSQGDVARALIPVASRWKRIGIQLRISVSQLNAMMWMKPVEAIVYMALKYLNEEYDTEKFGPPTWKKIIEAVDKPAGGDNPAEAMKIAYRHAKNIQFKSSHSSLHSVTDKRTKFRLLTLQIQLYDEPPPEYDQHIKMYSHKDFTGHWPPDGKMPNRYDLKEVKMTYGAVKPLKGERRISYIGTYDMSKWPHGICVIINNRNFTSTSDFRKGADFDEYNLIQTFCFLGYLVEVHRDCDSKRIKNIFEITKGRNHEMFDSFVCCIMSHGKEGHIIGSDDKAVSLSSISENFKGDICPRLCNKPKIFFIQACRGNETSNAVEVKQSDDIKQDGGEKGDSNPKSEKIPDNTDILFSFATPPNQVAWRSKSKGSWFISEICKSLVSYGTFLSLADMLAHTNDQVARNYSQNGFKQSPQVVHSRRKDIFFF